MGILQAVEAIKLMIGIDSGLKGKLMYYDGLETSFDIFKFQKKGIVHYVVIILPSTNLVIILLSVQNETLDCFSIRN